MIPNEIIKQIRTGELVLHCVEVEIFQTADNGCKMLGHGTIKINSVGTIYLEFICTHSENVPHAFFNKKLPKDPLNPEEKLYLRVKNLNGNEYKSDGFSIKINLNSSSLPAHYYVILSSIYSLSETELPKPKEDSYIYFEFADYFNIPSNKKNSVVSSLGSESHSWNQTVIQMDGYSVSMVKYKDYTEVKATGVFEADKLFKCLKFYIGFSSASMPQPYYMISITNGEEKRTVYSISDKQKRQTSSSPMVDSAADEKYRDSTYHYALLENIQSLYKDNSKHFDSVYSQWERVWYSFQSKNSIMILTLSVAIEGLLNDIYIPAIKSKDENIELNTEIDEIKAQIKNLKLTAEQCSRLLGSVSYWKNVTAAKALNYLVEHKIITSDDKKLWQNLRNESAHPKVREENLARERLEIEQVLSCLDLFHKLILNTLKFSGPIRVLQLKEHYGYVELNHIDVLS
ncbi:hypothetical protein AAIR29_08735 [Psychrobacter sp. FBL11]|uniref:ApeA N-terminal domain-containing protein n=1 Tax=Psychrobacter saeujeotis TaxID=3143436 RepID=A0ABU9X8M4_9GAMM